MKVKIIHKSTGDVLVSEDGTLNEDVIYNGKCLDLPKLQQLQRINRLRFLPVHDDGDPVTVADLAEMAIEAAPVAGTGPSRGGAKQKKR